ncbi:hypothetical protein [Pedobacter sp. R-06]|uniref:hypothetical protein n=1 Tax=Pedobacter sp. R-06 TaxID=3404051 RepID=UPI003CF8D53F
MQMAITEIPKRSGAGYIPKVGFRNDFRLMIHQRVLKEDLVIKRNPAGKVNDIRTISF